MGLGERMKIVFGMMIGLMMSATMVSAQMLDSLSNLAIQGTLTQQSTHRVGQGLSALKQNQILQDLAQTVTQIRINHMNGYTGLNTASVSGQPFKDISWSVGPHGTNQFYIQLEEMNMPTCRKLVSGMTEAREIQINNKVGTARNCQSVNTLTFIFD